MLILIPTPPKSTAVIFQCYFVMATIKSREPNTHARVSDMKNFYAMSMHLFFYHYETIWAGAYHQYDQRACAFVQSRQGPRYH